MPDQGLSAGAEGVGVDANITDDFAGDLFLLLATQGRLVVDAVRADALIADLERTIATLTARLRLVRIWRELPEPTLDDLPPDFAHSVVDAVFHDQLAPGRIERALDELPKYIQALRLARS